ncbi:type II restriction endonuclease [Marinomonas agarivorans]|nr:type II restriction endonuclease [Marinomonas agarivorans]
MSELGFLTAIPAEEQSDFDEFIQSARKQFISTPKDTVKSVLSENASLVAALKENKDISGVIQQLREKAFDSFLVAEAKMNAHILKHISDKFAVPAEKFEHLYTIFNQSSKEMKERLKDFFGEFSGQIYPYVYRLSLSNTQSRRSRAGKVFEGIIYGLYDEFDYSYESQAVIGSKNFKSKNLGKIVDSLLPNLNAFEERRDKVVIGTMKTTLRERWQEVIEEINRTGLPSIYLLTVDEDISANKVKQMANHNVILVVYKSVKQTQALKGKRNVVSFEDYFFNEIPEKLEYWKKQ